MRTWRIENRMSDEQHNQNDDQVNPEPEPTGKGPQQPPPMKPSRGWMSWILIIGAMIIVFVWLNSGQRGEPIGSWKEFTQLIDPEKGKIEKNLVTVENSRMVATVKPDGQPG